MLTLSSMCGLPPTSFFARVLEAFFHLSFFQKEHPRQSLIQSSRLSPERPSKEIRSPQTLEEDPLPRPTALLELLK
jgi:hypothetical protein